MTTAAAENELPEEIDALKRIVIEQRARIEALTLLIAKLRRMQFGRSSERVTQEIEQLELALDELQTEAAISERASAPEGKTNKAPRGVRKRQELLPVESARNLFGRTYLCLPLGRRNRQGMARKMSLLREGNGARSTIPAHRAGNGARLAEKKPAGVRCDSFLCRIIPASQPYRLWHTTFRVACRPCATCSSARPMAPLSLAGSSTFSP